MCSGLTPDGASGGTRHDANRGIAPRGEVGSRSVEHNLYALGVQFCARDDFSFFSEVSSFIFRTSSRLRRARKNAGKKRRREIGANRLIGYLLVGSRYRINAFGESSDFREPPTSRLSPFVHT